MNTETRVIVTTQAEFDAADKSKDIELSPTASIIVAVACTLICTSGAPRVVARESSSPSVEAWGSSSPRVEAWGSSSPRVEAWGSSSPSVVAWGSSSPSVVARESSSPRVAGLTADQFSAEGRSVVIDRSRMDILLVLDSAAPEVAALRDAVIGGKIDGSCYTGDCCCLVGTLEKARNAQPGTVVPRDSGRLAEQWFMRIKPGDTPETNPYSKRALEIIDEWMAERAAAQAPD